MERDEAQQLILDFKDTFESKHGSNVLKYLSRLCREQLPTYVDNNSLGTAYNEGLRGVILNIRSMLARDSREKRQEIAQDIAKE